MIKGTCSTQFMAQEEEVNRSTPLVQASGPDGWATYYTGNCFIGWLKHINSLLIRCVNSGQLKLIVVYVVCYSLVRTNIYAAFFCGLLDTTFGLASSKKDLSIQPPSSFWTDCGVRVTTNVWHRWETSFRNYSDLISDFHAALSKEKILKLLRHSLGNEGQRKFDDLGLQECKSVKEAFNALDRTWRYEMNVFTARYVFSRMHQGTVNL
ncbi:unnamed protein product [Dicrocoelium dendriticum]|nr:unnamed protein product [Dicrocoelium dendriticum]